MPYGAEPSTPIIDAEVLTDGTSLFVVTITTEERVSRIIHRRSGMMEMEEDAPPKGSESSPCTILDQI